LPAASTPDAKARRLSTRRIDPDAAVRLTITRTGAIDYVCDYHPSMRGRIVVN
jgi:plastocyanin